MRNTISFESNGLNNVILSHYSEYLPRPRDLPVSLQWRQASQHLKLGSDTQTISSHSFHALDKSEDTSVLPAVALTSTETPIDNFHVLHTCNGVQRRRTYWYNIWLLSRFALIQRLYGAIFVFCKSTWPGTGLNRNKELHLTFKRVERKKTVTWHW